MCLFVNVVGSSSRGLQRDFKERDKNLTAKKVAMIRSLYCFRMTLKSSALFCCHHSCVCHSLLSCCAEDANKR